MKQTKRRKRNNRQISMITVELAAFVVLAVYLTGYTVSAINKPSIATEVVTYGQIETPRKYTGIISRDEIVTFAKGDGKLYYNYGDQEYVKKGSVVCVTKKSEDADFLEQEIESINGDILEKQYLSEGEAAETDDIKRINSKIKNEVDSNSPYFHSFNGEDLYKFKYQLQKEMNSRNQMLITNGGTILNELTDKKNAYERELTNGTDSYVAEHGGVVSYNIDGLEQEITPETVFGLTPEQINDGSETEIKAIGDRLVKEGEPIFKIVRSNEWRIAVYLDNAITSSWKVGNSRYLYVKDGPETRKLSMSIGSIKEHGNMTYVVFESSKFMADFINMRNVVFSLEDGSYKGIKVPNSAIAEKTALLVPEKFIYDYRGFKGVYVKAENGYSFQQVNILSSGGDYCYVLQQFENMKLGTVIYSRAEKDSKIGDESFTIKDIAGVAGVYVANSGTAEFRVIERIADNERYSVIKNYNMYGVKVYDRIITDAQQVENNKILVK